MKKHNRNIQRQTCYMCDLPAISKEHVPPKCFFPEQKDLGTGTNYRRNLISVPACAKHNLSKSQDDEYLLFAITSHYDNDLAAQQHFSTKVMRAVRRRPSLLTFIADNFPIAVGGQPSIAYNVDRDRFDNAFDHMARALFFHHFNSKLNLPIIIHTPDIFRVNSPDANSVNLRMLQIDTKTIDALANQPTLGANPDIFYHQFRYFSEIPSFVVRMTFYRGFVVIAYASPSVRVSTGAALPSAFTHIQASR